jgi:hypothetical protein
VRANLNTPCHASESPCPPITRMRKPLYATASWRIFRLTTGQPDRGARLSVRSLHDLRSAGRLGNGRLGSPGPGGRASWCRASPSRARSTTPSWCGGARHRPARAVAKDQRVRAGAALVPGPHHDRSDRRRPSEIDDLAIGTLGGGEVPRRCDASPRRDSRAAAPVVIAVRSRIYFVSS